MAKLHIQNTNTTFDLKDGSSLHESCEEAGVHFGCGGQGFCGTCIVKVLSGNENLSAPTERELDFIGEEGVKEERMACQCKLLKGDVSIKI